MLDRFTRNIPLDKVFHNDQWCHITEGFGGKHISSWPVYEFFRMYLSGAKDEATRQYVEWYMHMLRDYGHISNRKYGGFYRGSLYRKILNAYGMPYADISNEDKEKVIYKRVAERFCLLDKIKEEGYDPTLEQVYAIRKNGAFYLKGGHHRAAILLALGYNEMPNVFVFPNTFFYKCFTYISKLKQYVGL